MDALQEAKQLTQDAYYHDRDRAAAELAMAAVHAAIAQAENASSQAHSLERIAESLERALPILSRIADALEQNYGMAAGPDLDDPDRPRYIARP